MFLQQMANRAAASGFTQFADDARRHLSERGHAHFAQLWRTQNSSPELQRTIVGHGQWMPFVALGPTGRLLVTVSQDASYSGTSTIGIWETATGRLVERLLAPEQVTGLHVMDEDHLLTAGGSGQLRLWHLPTGRVVRETPGSHPIRALAVSGDGRSALSAGAGNALLKWDLEQWTKAEVLGTPKGGPDVIAGCRTARTPWLRAGERWTSGTSRPVSESGSGSCASPRSPLYC